MVIGLGCAAIYLSVVPAQYEAVLLVKSGQIRGSAGETPVQTPQQMCDRLRSSMFQSSALTSLGWSGRTAELYRSSFLVTPHYDFIEIKLRATAPAEAQRAAEDTIADLEKIQRWIVDESHRAIAAAAKTQLATTMSEISEDEAGISRLERLGQRIPSNNYREMLAFMQMLDSQKVRLRALHHQEEMARANLLPPEFSGPTLVQPIYVSDAPVFPKAGQILLAAAFCGLFLGGMAAVSRRAGDGR